MLNFNDFIKSIDRYKNIINCSLLSSEEELNLKIGKAGLKMQNMIPRDVFINVYNRNICFYKNILGWSDSDIYERTEVLATCYNIMGNYFKHKYGDSSIMFWTESAYERARMYSGLSQDKPLPILFPVKHE